MVVTENAKKPKMRKCKAIGCDNMFEQWNSFIKVCSTICGRIYDEEKRIRQVKKDGIALRKDTRERKLKLKTTAQWLREAQMEFNKYIRLRDRGLPCISCDKPDDGTHQRHASHYRPTSMHSALRFNELNTNASCQQCNTTKSGNLIEYRKRLIKKRSEATVEWLEGPQDDPEWNNDRAKGIKLFYIEKCKAMKAEIENA